MPEEPLNVSIHRKGEELPSSVNQAKLQQRCPISLLVHLNPIGILKYNHPHYQNHGIFEPDVAGA